MKEIKAIIRPDRLQAVCDALAGIADLPGLTVSAVTGWGRSRARGAASPVRVGAHAFAPKTKLELVVADELVDAVVTAIRDATRTGGPGDGKVFVIDVVDVVRVRTGERGQDAL